MRSPRLLLPLLAALLAIVVGGLAAPAGAARTTGAAVPAHALAAVSIPASIPASTSAKVKPAQDFPRIPRECATRAEKIPSSPLICYLRPFKSDRPTVMLWGDSHAWMFIPALKAALKGHKVNLVASLMGSCPPMDTNYKPGSAAPACIRSNDLGLRYVLDLAKGKQPVRVVLGSSWQRYLHALKVHDHATYVGQMSRYFKQGTPRLFKTLARKKIGVDVIGQVATVPDQHADCRKGNQPFSCNLPRKRALPEFASTMRWVNQQSRVLPEGYKPILVNRFCTAKVCHGLVKGVHTWFDDFHISATLSASLADKFARTVKKVDPPAKNDDDNGGGSGGCTLLIFCR